MADLVLEPSADGGQIAFLSNGDFKTTDALYNAGYVALLSAKYWGNSIATPNSRLNSRLNELFNQTVTSSTRNLAERYANEALAFFVTSGIADEITIDAQIKSAFYILLTVKINQPDGTILDFEYGLNWKSQSVELPFQGIV